MTANIFGADLGIVLVIILLVVVFGSQLPKLARNAGLAGREFRKAQREAEQDAEGDRRSKAARAEAGTSLPPGAPAQGASVQLTQSELDALLQAREDQVRREGAGPGS